MRESLYKAKRIDNGKWVNGYLIKIHREERVFILPSEFIKKGTLTMRGELPPNFLAIEVDIKTVCEHINKTDKYGVLLFENDIIKTKYGRLCQVKWKATNEFVGFDLIPLQAKHKAPQKWDLWYKDNIEFVGNIYDDNLYDNPDILD